MFWIDNQVVLAIFQVGSKYLGNVVHSPPGVGAPLRQLVLPQFRGGVAALNVSNEAAVAALARAAQETQPRRRKKRAR